MDYPLSRVAMDLKFGLSFIYDCDVYMRAGTALVSLCKSAYWSGYSLLVYAIHTGNILRTGSNISELYNDSRIRSYFQNFFFLNS